MNVGTLEIIAAISAAAIIAYAAGFSVGLGVGKDASKEKEQIDNFLKDQ